MTPFTMMVAGLIGVKAEDKGKDLECDGTDWCGVEACQKCCNHDELDHGICIDCGKDEYDSCVAAAESAFEGDR